MGCGVGLRGRESIERLIELASSPILSSFSQAGGHEEITSSGLADILSGKNGFYAFESALHLFPSGQLSGQVSDHSLESWNDPSLWRQGFPGLDPDFLFFAEDVFGDQFFVAQGEVGIVESETAEVEKFSSSLEEWAEKILSDYDMWTGYPVAHEWQRINGCLPSGMRLTPKIPFVAGGSYGVENLYAAESVKIMRFRADFFDQIKNIADGVAVKISIIE